MLRANCQVVIVLWPDVAHSNDRIEHPLNYDAPCLSFDEKLSQHLIIVNFKDGNKPRDGGERQNYRDDFDIEGQVIRPAKLILKSIGIIW